MKKNLIVLIAAAVILLGAGCVAENKNGNINGNTNGNANVPGEWNVLDLSNRGLTSVSVDIFNDTGLTELNLSRNNLTGALPAEVRKLQNLEFLDLSYNKFTGVPAEVGQLRKLKILDLSNNQLTGLPYEIGNLTQLEILDVSGNDYSAADLEKIVSTLPNTQILK
jgi:Leucine-rich repeat (LRR) protein